MRAGKCTSICLVGYREHAIACKGSCITCCWHPVPPTLQQRPGVLCDAVDTIGNHSNSSGGPAGCCVPSRSPADLLRGLHPRVSFSHAPGLPASVFSRHIKHITACWGPLQCLHLHQAQCDVPHIWAHQVLQQRCSVCIMGL